VRILYASNSLIPSTTANSVQVMKMCAAFAAHGHSVDLLCHSTQDQASDAFSRYGVPESFRLSLIPQGRVPGVRRLRRAHGARRMAKNSPMYDVLYGRDLFGTYAACAHVPAVIFEAHVPPKNHFEQWLMNRLFEKPSFARLVTISDALDNEYRRLFPELPAKRCIVAHDAASSFADVELEPVTDWPGRPGVLQFGYVGSLLPGKGAEQVCILARRFPQYDFHIVGGRQTEVESLRRNHERDANLFFHGHISHARVGAYLYKLDVALFPMQERVLVADGVDIARWTSPMKLFEYMAARRAIVSSDLPVLREVLRDGENALLVPPGDIEAWCRAIERLASGEDVRAKLGARAYEDFIGNYTWGKRAARVLEGVD
jgi:glycosyltransferase involved in cell wall biosynthesis